MIVDCAVYTKGRRRPGMLELQDALETSREDDSFVWIGLLEPTDEEFAAVTEEFHLHDLAVEDAIHAHQRPKLEIYGDMLFVVVRTARYDDEAEAVEFAELQIFIGERYVISVRHGRPSPLAEVRKELESDRERCRLGPLAVVHAILDHVVDDYQPVLDGLDNDIVESETEVFEPGSRNPAPRLYLLKRQVLSLYRAIEPLLEPLAVLRAGRHPLGGGHLDPYFRDVEDHLRKAVSRVESQREMLTDAMNVNLAQISMQQNEDMRRISGWAAIAAVPTLLAGIWGMNFDHMPELGTTWGYPAALATILVAVYVLYRTLKSRGWI